MTTTKGLNDPLTHPPLAHEVKSLRRHVETAMNISTTAAQSICAGATYSHLRTWLGGGRAKHACQCMGAGADKTQ